MKQRKTSPISLFSCLHLCQKNEWVGHSLHKIHPPKSFFSKRPKEKHHPLSQFFPCIFCWKNWVVQSLQYFHSHQMKEKSSEKHNPLTFLCFPTQNPQRKTPPIINSPLFFIALHFGWNHTFLNFTSKQSTKEQTKQTNKQRVLD